MADFFTAVTKTLEYEGGLVDNPNDPGGLTNFGIALRKHPEFTEDYIRNLTKVQAIDIYRQKYWGLLYSKIDDQALANSLFDFGVTSGPYQAVEVLQTTFMLPEHGVMDERTLERINSLRPRQLRIEFTVARLKFYTAIPQPKDWHAWFTRTIDALL
jgi:lysozyme family protein